jgi:hypothetical protein
VVIKLDPERYFGLLSGPLGEHLLIASSQEYVSWDLETVAVKRGGLVLTHQPPVYIVQMLPMSSLLLIRQPYAITLPPAFVTETHSHFYYQGQSPLLVAMMSLIALDGVLLAHLGLFSLDWPLLLGHIITRIIDLLPRFVIPWYASSTPRLCTRLGRNPIPFLNILLISC